MNHTFVQRALATGAGALLGAAGTFAWLVGTGRYVRGESPGAPPPQFSVSWEAVAAPRQPQAAATAVPQSAPTLGAPVHTVAAVSERGDFIRLESGTLWKVSATDQQEAAFWSPDMRVVVERSGNARYPYRFVHTLHRDTVLVRSVQ